MMPALGGSTRWQNCDESRPVEADKLLIKPTGGPTGPAQGKTSHRQGTPKRVRAASLSTSHSAPQDQPASDHQAAPEVSQFVKQ